MNSGTETEFLLDSRFRRNDNFPFMSTSHQSPVTNHRDREADMHWMQQAIAQAYEAQAAGEVPVGAILAKNNEFIAQGWNRPISSCDPSAHAEIVTLRAAAARLGNYRLPGCTLYVTLEPCAMCAGAIIQARLERVVYGATDTKTGAAGSVFDILGTPKLNHVVAVEAGVMAEACGAVLTRFFRGRRMEQGL